MFQTIADSNDPLLLHIKPLYEDTFPIHERRRWEVLLLLLEQPKMHLNAMMDQEQFIGLVIYWKLENWLYLEHLAVKPEFRGREYGREVIEHLKEQSGRKLILETELPENREAVRRIHFYKKCGLQLIAYPYRQPPYRKQESFFPMMLMSPGEITNQQCKQVVSLIKQEVYEKFY